MMHADSAMLNDLSGRVIGCAFTVLNTLGVGFLEKVYENALANEMRAAGLAVMQQCSVRVHYNDVVVEDMLLLELKDCQSTGRRAQDAMHQLPQSDRHAALPAA
jgi:GxxExxY protein